MSGMFGALDAAASGAGLGRVWMDVIADNVANVNTVRPAGEEPFRAAQVEAQAAPAQDGVVVAGMRLKGGDPEVVYDPDNPLADSRGYVTHPQVDLSEEMTNMLIANRLYDANLSVMQQARESYQACPPDRQELMTILPISAASIVAPTAGTSAATASATATTGSQSLFAKGLDQVQALQDSANVASQGVATGGLTNIHDFTTAAAKASLGVELTVALRNKAVEAYQEIMRMQI